jgi:hypothetical protein
MDQAKASPIALRISNDPMHKLLREGCMKEFNVRTSAD